MQKDQAFEMYDYARRRVKQKKMLFFHFIVFALGSLLFFVFNTFIQEPSKPTLEPIDVVSTETVVVWWPYAVGIWAFLFFLHLINVLIVNSFMGQKWQDKEVQRLVLLQERKIEELRKKVEKDYPLVDVKRDLPQGEDKTI